MPSVNDTGFNPGESDQHVSNAASGDAAQPSAPAPRRRRGGRRVVRGAGAAGAAVALKVEDHSIPLFTEPKSAPDDAPADGSDAPADGESQPTRRSRRSASRSRKTAAAAESASAETSDAAADASQSDAKSDAPAESQPTRTRVRRRSAIFSALEDDIEDARASRTSTRTRRRGNHDEAAEASSDDMSRALDVIDTLPQSAHKSHAMTSILFQEPVLPSLDRVRKRGAGHDDADADGRDVSGRDVDGRDAAADSAGEDETKPTRSRRSRSGRGGDSSARRGNLSHIERIDSIDDNAGAADDDSDVITLDSAVKGDDDGETTERQGKRNRRLNAQERRAAAEVEQIEEDLELDDISYTPIDGEEGGRTRRRRRNRNRSADDAAREPQQADDTEKSDDDAQPQENVRVLRRSRAAEDEDDDATVTRRRRRRRSRASEEDDEPVVVRRSRKQQYIDEITDVEGSTRLEAKKQRRRDNRRERSRQSQLMEQDFLARRENVNRLMVVRERGHHTQISVIEDNVLVEHYVSDIQEVATVGNIYLGRVQNVLPSMEAAFVDIGQSRNGVLYAGEVNWDATRLEGQPRRIELAFKSGDPVLVQVTKDPIGHKGARLTSQVTLAGRFLVLVPSGGMTGVSRKLSERERSRLKGIVSKIAPKDMGVIIRTAAEGASEEAIVKDLDSLVRQWERINAKREEFWHGKRPKLLQGEPDVAIRVVRDIFNDDFSELIVEGDKVYERIEEYLDTMAPDLKGKLVRWDPSEHQGKDVFDKWQIDAQLRKGMERQVYLPSGGSIVIDRTEAMTTIDVNTGRFIGRGKSLEETVTRCNLEAAEEIARQLRLRDIGGMVMIDFVDMVMPANRDLVLRRLVECLARDRTKHQVAEVTSLGLVQMTRKRIGQGLVEAFSEECPTCKGRGFILHDEPTVSADYDDPYALKGGDPFIKTNKHGRGTDVPVPQGSSADVKAKLAQIAAAAVAAGSDDDEE
ncbi:Rne/Rng family ribonuclease [Bifidobacterium leontopitheci]|uniref:Rne/Rng family ribonuclease n=1 Tax=Bifidobacterium leontopitheci TaxID=2650774 RepID=UPI0012657E08|nr:Rne/Rng family ribonuclease [Bifidobacterium leontopitheci]